MSRSWSRYFHGFVKLVVCFAVIDGAIAQRCRPFSFLAKSVTQASGRSVQSLLTERAPSYPWWGFEDQANALKQVCLSVKYDCQQKSWSSATWRCSCDARASTGYTYRRRSAVRWLWKRGSCGFYSELMWCSLSLHPPSRIRLDRHIPS